MELKVRTNEIGQYVIIHSNNFNEGINYAVENQLSQVQIRGAIGTGEQVVDFKRFELIASSLKSLSFSGINDGNTKIVNFEYIYRLQALERLDLLETTSFKIEIPKFLSLNHLGIAYSSNIIDLWKAVNLETLVITEGYPTEDLNILQDFSLLQKLHIYKSPKLKSLIGIENLKSLAELKLAFNSKLSNIEDINCARICVFQIEKCKHLKDLSILKGNSFIKELFATEVESLQFIKSMERLERIHFWDCKDGDMTPLLESPSLKKAYLTKDKKHYSHTQKEISMHLNMK